MRAYGPFVNGDHGDAAPTGTLDLKQFRCALDALGSFECAQVVVGLSNVSGVGDSTESRYVSSPPAFAVLANAPLPTTAVPFR